MSTDTAWSSINIEFWADIDGTEVECVAAMFTYAMNKIPQARFVAAVGRDVHSNAASSAHKLADTKLMTPVKLYAKCSNKAGQASVAMPVGQKLVFDGYVTGVGMSRGIDSYRIAFSAVHWLVDLTYGTVLSAVSHPRNPADLAFNANWGANANPEGAQGGAGQSDETYWAYNNSANTFVTERNVKKDLWTEAIQKWLIALAGREMWGPDADNNDINNYTNSGSRLKAIDALKNIKADPALSMDAKLHANTARKIADDITCQSTDLRRYTLNSLATTNFWSLIISLSTSYMFSIIPFPDKAKVVPFIEGYRTHFQGDHALAGFSIAARDLGNIDITNALPRRLGGYIVMGSALDHVQGTLQADGAQNSNVLGSFVPDADAGGMLMMHEAPRWLNGQAHPTTAGSSMGLSGNVTANGVAHPGDTGTSTTATTSSTEEESNDTSNVNNMINKYAQALYCCDALRQRHGKIIGPLRLDICPGSTVKFEGVSEKYTPGTQPIGHARFGHIVSVTCVLDGHGGKAKTIYDISHLRTEKENTEDSTSISGHPLYNTVWSGEALI